MRPVIILILLGLLAYAGAVQAASSDAREVARINNCPPKKVEVYQQTTGAAGKTVYRVECNLPKAKDENAAQTAGALLIQCEGSLCDMLRPVSMEN